MTITLRPYQVDAIERVREAMRSHRRVLLVAPTGFGKTATAAELIQRAVARGRSVLFLVHRREIVQDTARRLRAAGVACVIEMAGVGRVGSAAVTVASVATITARECEPPADLVIWDEAHHTAAESYRAIAARYPRAHHLGLTATPERGDGQGLRDAFDAIVIGATMRELQALDWLAELDVIAPGTTLRGGIAMAPAEAWRTFASGRPTVAFCRSVKESQALVDELGPSVARHLDGTTPARVRDTMLEQFSRGEFAVLSNVFVLTEGWDCSTAKVCLLARGAGTIGAYIQMCGRVLRRHGDERALLIDLAGAAHKHGLPDEDREFSLDGIKGRKKSDREWLSQCQACGTVVRGVTRGETCVQCGAPWPAREPLKVRPTKMSPIDRAAITPPSQRKREYERLVAIAAERGYKPGWALHRYRARFGAWPEGVRG